MSDTIKWSTLTPEQRNAIVAEKAMGLRVHRYPSQHYELGDMPEIAVLVDEEDIIRGNPAKYTQSMDAAWQVVERITQPPQSREEALQAANTQFMLWWKQAELWSCSTEEAANEICLAALRAVGVQVEYEVQP